MPRHTACAVCGTRIAANQSSRAAPTCRSCRWAVHRASRPHGRARYLKGCRCETCRAANTVACGDRVGRKATARPCAICGTAFTSRIPHEVLCSDACRRVRKREHDQFRRALRRTASVSRVNPLDIYERDGWRCHICHRPILRDKAWPHPRSRSIDHLIPLTRGGNHEPANVKAACLRCNLSKGNRGGNEQLLLIG